MKTLKEPMPYYPAYPDHLKVWELTFWELSRRPSNAIPRDAEKLAGVSGVYLKQIKPGSDKDMTIYRACVKQAFLWGYYAWALYRGVMGHRRLKNIYRSAGLTYPALLDSVPITPNMSAYELREPVPKQWVQTLTEG